MPVSHLTLIVVGIILLVLWYVGFLFLVLCSFDERAGGSWFSLLPRAFQRDGKSRGKKARKEERRRREEQREEERRALLHMNPWEVPAVRRRLGLDKLRDEDED